MERVRWGILGCGSIATSAIAPAIRWSANGELRGVGSRSPERARAKAEEVGAPIGYGDYASLLADPAVEAVYLGLPNGEHARWAIAAAQAGKHVLCDKSLALRLDDARAMRAAFDARGLRLVEGFMVRHHPQWDLVRRLLRDGAIGGVRFVRAWLAGSAPAAGHRWSAALGGGALFDVTCYGVNAARMVIGEEPRRVLAAARWAGPGVDEASDAILEFPGGAVAVVHGSLRSPFEQGVVIVGEHGRIILERPFVPHWDPVEVVLESSGSRAAHGVGGANHFLHQIEHFGALVRDPSAALDPAEDGVANIAVCVAIAGAAAGDGRAAVAPVAARGHVDSDILVGAVPLRVTTPTDRPAAPAVIFLHGLSASKKTHAREARSLAAAGLATALPDAPHHGARRGPLLDAMAAATSDDDRHALFLHLVEQAAAEVPAIVDALLARGHPRVAIAGISLGGFTALAAATAEPRLAAVVSILGSPDWTPSTGKVPAELEAVVGRAPVHRLTSFPPRPVALLNAGRDGTVPPAAARRFADALRPLYASAPDDLLHREYPESDHMMREDEWRDLWATTVAFLRRALDRGELA